MSGRGTAAVVLSALDDLAEHQPWRTWLAHVPVPRYFYGPEEYRAWLRDAGFISQRVEIVPPPMRQPGLAGLESWLRTAWIPYSDGVLHDHRAAFACEVARTVLERCPAAADGSVLLPMVNLEVEALKPTD